MDIEFVRNRITELRLKKGISEYRLSYDLGHGKNYVRNITSGHSNPSVKELLLLIEQLGVTPKEFFDENKDSKNPILVKQINDSMDSLSDDDLHAILSIINRITNKSP